MSAIRYQPVDERLAWKGADMAQSEEWLYRFTDRVLVEIDTALEGIERRGLAIPDVTAEDFVVPALERDLQRIAQELEHGRGFVQMKGLPVDRYTQRQAELVFWGIGTHFGAALPQNRKGELIGHVRDEGGDVASGNVRAYQTRVGQSFHTDMAGDVVGLLCLRGAKAGGASRVASSMAVYNELLARHPEYVEALYNTFDIDWRGEQQPGASPVYHEPIYAYANGTLRCKFQPRLVRSALAKTGGALTTLEEDAICAVERIAQELCFDIQFDPGDIQLINNYAILHGRTAYEDHADPARKRYLLRLWLNLRGDRTLPEAFARSTARAGVPVG
ncbi:MAG TPA: TauD/TfdA family dioxygenase [Burkholderiales bacterium]|nr:TauD/TfdA family dioxygenase [Burkholderiales bacterium]